MAIVNVIDRPTSLCLDHPMAFFIGPTTGPDVWTAGTPAHLSDAPPAPTLRRDFVQKPFRKPPRATEARDIAVHVPRLHEMLGRPDPDAPNRRD